MSEAVADAAIDLLIAHSGGAPRLNVSFYGGEPFLEPALLDRILDRARISAKPGQRIRCLTPTNGTRLDDAALRLCRKQGIDLAISIDGVAGAVQRPYTDGQDSTPDLISRLPALLASGSCGGGLARMTVTPTNVGVLSTNVRALARLGFSKIVFQPAWELAWTEVAIRAWGRELERIATWASGARAAGLPVPALPALQAVEDRLLRGKRPRGCGAGARFCAVTTDGELFPCFRFMFESGVEECRLGDVRRGFTEPATRAEFSALSPDEQCPEVGSCASCPARDGCVHYCPALGFLMLRDLRAVPAVACEMMRAQVEAVRRGLAASTRPAGRVATAGWAAAIVAAGSALGLAACGGDTDSDQTRTAVDASTTFDASGTDAGADAFVGGVCAEPVDASMDSAGGICPEIILDDADVPPPDICSGIC